MAATEREKEMLMHDSLGRFSRSAIVMITLISALSIFGSLAFACAAPLTAIAAFAGLAMRRKLGLTIVGAAWLSNQIVGFGFLNYPQTVDTFAWGAAIGVSAFVAFFAAHGVMERLRSASPILTTPLVFLVAFCVYQFVLFVMGYPLEGSDATLAGDVIRRVFEVNLVSFGALLLLQWVWSFVRPVASTRHA